MKLEASTLRASFSYPTSQLADRCDRLRHSLHTDAPLADLHTTTPRPVLLEHVLDENATAWSQQQLTRPTGDACSAEASRPPYAAPPRTHAPSTARPDGIAPQRQELQPSKYNIYEHARTHTHTHRSDRPSAARMECSTNIAERRPLPPMLPPQHTKARAQGGGRLRCVADDAQDLRRLRRCISAPPPIATSRVPGEGQ